MYEVSWHFVHSFTSYSHLSGTTFAFVLYHHDNVTHVLESDGQIGAITIRIGCSPTVFSRLGPQRLLSVPKPQAVAPEKEIHIEWGSHRGNRGVFRRLGRFVFYSRKYLVNCLRHDLYYSDLMREIHYYYNLLKLICYLECPSPLDTECRTVEIVEKAFSIAWNKRLEREERLAVHSRCAEGEHTYIGSCLSVWLPVRQTTVWFCVASSTQNTWSTQEH